MSARDSGWSTSRKACWLLDFGEIRRRCTNGNIGLSETVKKESSVFIPLKGPALVQKELG
jgi:hypothetical protein